MNRIYENNKPIYLRAEGEVQGEYEYGRVEFSRVRWTFLICIYFGNNSIRLSSIEMDLKNQIIGIALRRTSYRVMKTNSHGLFTPQTCQRPVRKVCRIVEAEKEVMGSGPVGQYV